MGQKENRGSIFHSWPFSKKNYMLFLIGLVTIIIRYVIMYTGETSSYQSIVIAPIILIIGYCIIIPISIFIK